MTNNNYVNIYVNFLKKFANLKKPLKVVLDCSNGPVGLILKKLKILDSRFYILNSKVDGRFPAHSPNPLEPHALDDVKKAIKRRKADLGVVFDADADRAVFVDNLGRKMPFYALFYLLTLKSRPPFVADVYISKTLKHLNLLKVVPSKVGVYFMKKKMKEAGASLGNELSGHYFFREIKNADSGILAAIKALNALSKMPYTAAQFVDLLPDFYYEQFNKKTENPAVLMKKILKIYRKKAIKNSRWFLVIRPSNTEPLLRFFVGSKDKRVFQKELKKLKALLP